MSTARAVAELLTVNLRHPGGQPVECVIADTTIGGVAEAAACAAKLPAPVWVYPFPSRHAGAMALKPWIWIP